MKTLLKILIFILNVSLVFLLVILVKSEFRNDDKEVNNVQDVAIVVDKVDILSLLKEEYGELYAKSSLDSSYNDLQIDSSKIKKDSELLSDFDTVANVNGNLCITSGWLFSEKSVVDYIVFVDENYKVLGAGVVGIYREGLSVALGKKNADDKGWAGYLTIDTEKTDVRALSKISGKDEFIDLGVYKYQ